MATYILGVRHHGPGSARRVRERLEALRPDLILVEGPPEAEELLGQVAREGMKPPVALLAYEPTNPQNAVFYPFAAFSPEWQAMLYAATQGTELHFFDLPLIYHLAQTEVRQRRRARQAQAKLPLTRLQRSCLLPLQSRPSRLPQLQTKSPPWR